MLIKQTRDEIIIKEIATTQRRVHYPLSQNLAHLSAKPLFDRRAKAPLAAIENVLRQNFFQGSLQNVFAAGSLDFKFTRHAERVFHQTMIQERHARFD